MRSYLLTAATLLLLVFELLVGVSEAQDALGPEQIQMEVGQSLFLSWADLSQNISPLERMSLSSPDAVNVQQVEGGLILFAQSASDTQLGLWFKNKTYLEVQIQVRSKERALLEGFLSLYAPSSVQQHKTAQAIWLRGEVSNKTGEQLRLLAQNFPELRIEQLQIAEPEPQMIELEVQVVEFKQSYLKQQGFSWNPSATGPSFGMLSDWVGGRKFRLFNSDGGAWYPEASVLGEQPWLGMQGYLGWRTSLSSTLNILEERGVAKILATPRLRVESGESAEFLAGGELPIPKINLNGAMDVNFHPYGIRLATTASLLANGTVRTEVEAELSRIDYSVAVQGVPGLLTRRNHTVVILPARETVVLSGLKSTEFQNSESGLPGYSNLKGPFKRLASSQEESLQNTELIIFITPRIVAEEEARQRQQRERTKYYYQLLALTSCTIGVQLEKAVQES